MTTNRRAVNKATAAPSPNISIASIPAPVGGLNARDAIANMPKTDALLLDNWFCAPSQVMVRNGYSNNVTGLPGWVETLMAYNGTSTKKLFAASSTGFYDVTSSGAVGAAVVTSLTNAQWQYINFQTLGGNYLYAVNGADKPRLYDGTTWTAIDGVSTPAITGVTTTNLIQIYSFKNRIWFIEKTSTKAWYLPLNSIGGAAVSLDLGPLFKLGGYLMAMVSWTISNTSGVDDYAAFISSEGEVVLYRGYDPTYASSWALVGTFRAGRPIGRRCFVKYSGDVLLITADGIFPISKLLAADRKAEDAITYKIMNAVSDDVQAYASNFGWQICYYPIGSKLIINVPSVQNSVQYQYVMNTVTKAWSRFTGWNAACWEVFNDSVYFGGNTVVALADSGTSDNNAAITATAKPAFSYFGQRNQKKFNLVRPIFTSDGLLRAAVALCTDFNDITPTAIPSYSGSGGAVWDTSSWNTTDWGGTNNVITDWQTIPGIGFAATIKMQVQSKNIQVGWQSTDYCFESGGVL